MTHVLRFMILQIIVEINGLEFLASIMRLPNELMALSIDVKSNDKKMRNPKRAKMDPTINWNGRQINTSRLTKLLADCSRDLRRRWSSLTCCSSLSKWCISISFMLPSSPSNLSFKSRIWFSVIQIKRWNTIVNMRLLHLDI